MERDSLDDILKRKLEDFSLRDVPSWAQMQRRMTLPVKETAFVPSGRLRRRLHAGSIAAALVLLAVGTGWWLRRPDVPEPFAIDPGTGPSTVEWSVPPLRDTTEPDPLRDPVLNRLFASARKIRVVMPGAESLPSENEVGREVRTASAADAPGCPDSSERSGAEAAPRLVASAENGASASRRTVRTRSAASGPDFRTRRADLRWTVSLYVASSAFSSGVSRSSLPMSVSAVHSVFDEAGVFGKTNASALGTRRMDHRFPVSVGMSVRKCLTPKLGIETGLVYSSLHSSVRSEGAFAYRYDQRVHYLGIPLALSYSVFDGRRFGCYVAGGVMAEAVLSAEGTTEIYNGERFVSAVTDRIGADGLLWSASLRAGVDVKITDDFGLYAEPGVVRRLGRADHPVSLKTEKPWNADLRIGLRFSF